MRKTRRAAAMCMIMSLAVSTVLGNTAWGEVTVNTKKNHCTHVHTEECYEDADEDETATPSQSGKRKPTACTHVCTVESGCLADDEDTEEDDAWTTATSSDADQEDADSEKDEDGGVSVGTPSDADDKTKEASQTKILSWSWLDPERNLTDGRLELTGVTPEAQPSFEEITEYLPKTIIAETGEDEDWEAEYLDLAGWTCDEYTQDEEGLWPLNGTYEFAAELPEGYALADDVEALTVEVSVEGDQAVALAEEQTIMNINFAKNEEPMDLKFDGSKFSGSPVSSGKLAASGMTVRCVGADQYELELNNTSISTITIASGNWKIILNGNNSLNGLGKSVNGVALSIKSWCSVTIDGAENAVLTAQEGNNGKDSSAIIVYENATLTISGGTMNATAKYPGTSPEVAAAILVSGTLNMDGGTVNARGEGKSALIVRNNSSRFSMSGGIFEATGIRESVVENRGTFELSGGTFTANSESDGIGFITYVDSAVVENGGNMETSRLWVKNGTMTIEKGGILTTSSTVLDKGSLVNEGTFVSNGAFENDEGTFTNTGTISGTGAVPDKNKTAPGAISVSRDAWTEDYTGNTITIPKSITITKPSDSGKLAYEIVENESTGTGTIDLETGVLAVEKSGTFRIKIYTQPTGIHKEGEPVYVTLTVAPADFPKDWTLNVDAVDTTYSGKSVDAVAISGNTIPTEANAKYQYQISRINNADVLPDDQWESACPTIKNAADSGQYVFVRVLTDNYKPNVFASANTTKITPRSLETDVKAGFAGDYVYNGKPHNPVFQVVENWKNAGGNELEKDVDYTVTWENKAGEAVSELIDAGTYIAKLQATNAETVSGGGNYTGTISVPFTIRKWEIVPNMVGRTFNKIYDGTRNVNDDQELQIYFWTKNEGWTLREIQASSVQWEYEGENVGKHYLRAYDIAIPEEYQKNYELTGTEVKYVGNILERDFASITVSADPLTYNGEEQQAQISASVDTGLDNVPADVVYTYSLDGVDFQSEMPSFTDAGTYLVHVKAEMDNFNEATETVPVTVQKAEAPAAAELEESYGYKETGEKRLKLPEIPADCGTLGTMEAKVVSDDGQILTGGVTISGSELVFQLKGSSRTQIGQTARILVTVETQNYQDIQIPVTITLKGESGNSSSGSGSSSGSSHSDSSGSGSAGAGSKANSGQVNQDSQKGYVSTTQGIITGAPNQAANDGYSHWMKDDKGWWLRYSDGSWPKGDGAQHWEMINGRWWAFGADGYLSTGWVYDTSYENWFYMNENEGMLTGWQFIDGKWYYFHPDSDGNRGIMYTNRRTPDGWYLKEDGSWDEEAAK